MKTNTLEDKTDKSNVLAYIRILLYIIFIIYYALLRSHSHIYVMNMNYEYSYKRCIPTTDDDLLVHIDLVISLLIISYCKLY